MGLSSVRALELGLVRGSLYKCYYFHYIDNYSLMITVSMFMLVLRVLNVLRVCVGGLQESRCRFDAAGFSKSEITGPRAMQ